VSIARLMFGNLHASVKSQLPGDRERCNREGAIKEDGENSKKYERTANGKPDDEKVCAHTLSVRCTKRRRVLR
jgi:hypothetical protein